MDQVLNLQSCYFKLLLQAYQTEINRSCVPGCCVANVITLAVCDKVLDPKYKEGEARDGR